jgi:hypothetical protein
MITQKEVVLNWFLQHKGERITTMDFRLEMLKSYVLQPLEYIKQLRREGHPIKTIQSADNPKVYLYAYEFGGDNNAK